MLYDYIACEVHHDCLDCPLSICKWDDLPWFRRSVRMGRWYAMLEMQLGGASVEDTAAVFGVTVRTVYRSIARVNNGSISPGDRAVFARLAPNLPEALRTEPPLPRPRACRKCGEDISGRDYRARLCYRCGEARNRAKKSSVRAEPPAQYLSGQAGCHRDGPAEPFVSHRSRNRRRGDMSAKTREQIDLELIDDNPWQPRAEIDEEALRELADSIHQLGLLQAPLGRRAEGGRIQAAFGHRRVAACRLLHSEGKAGPQIEMDVTDISDEDMVVLALTENERRQQLTQIEVVKAHQRAIEETALTVQELAKQLGMNRSTLANNLRVLELPEFVLGHVESGDLGLTVAREFLVLQNGDHVHTQDMQDVIQQIVRTWGYQGAPDWSRRHVRQLICRRVSLNEADFRPLGPRHGNNSYGGANREATFDVDAFSAERSGMLHTIPADDDGGKYESSRVWTCDVKAWRSWQTNASRAANKEAVATGGERAVNSNRTPSRDEQLAQLMESDPVWLQIAAAREKPGPSRPVTDEEREQLGTRAEFRDVGHYGEGFWKILQKGRPEDSRSWERQEGGLVPPWFPNLKECQRCTIGASYAKSRGGYPLSDAKLVCFNQEHYQEKLRAGEAKYRAKLEESRKGIDRQDRKAVEKFTEQLQSLSDSACYALATSLLTAEPRLEWLHPTGAYHEDYSYESAAGTRARELLNLEAEADWRLQTRIELEALASVEPGEVRELVASLMTHHLRLAGRVGTVSRETPPSDPTT